MQCVCIRLQLLCGRGPQTTRTKSESGSLRLPQQRLQNGEGHTFKERNSWRTVIRHEGHIVSASAPKKDESRRLAKLKVAKLIAAGVAPARFDQQFTIEEFMPAWLEEQHRPHLAYNTYIRYRGLMRRFIVPGLGQMRLDKVTKAEINRLFASMQAQGQKPRSIQQARSLLSIAFRAAVEADLLNRNPVPDTKRYTGAAKPITPLTADETRRLLAAHQGTPMLARLHVAILCGLRQGEALGLRWTDIDFDNASLTVRQQVQKVEGKVVFTSLKSACSSRTVALPEATVIALRQHRAHLAVARERAGEGWTEHDLVFPNRYGRPQQSKWDYERWQRALDACGITRRPLHSARHTLGTLMHEQSVDVETIRRTLGHSNVQLTSRTYVHATAAPLHAAAGRLNSLLEGVNE